MKPAVLTSRLEAAVASGDVEGESEAIAEDMNYEGAGLEAVTCILQCMRAHPEADFGMPGPLVHFVEKFYKKGYEAVLIASVQERPTPHTLWMLNRVINGTKEAKVRESLAGVLRAAAERTDVEEETREQAREFLELHS